jgi:hypothetical protein
MMSIDRHHELGYRIWAPRHGRHVVSADGATIRSALPQVAPWRWQRLLFAQVLPLAAALNGVQVFHASAVALGGFSVGFIASSGTGKTSVAAHLVARGAALVTDDALALEGTSDGVVAYPGAAMASIDRSELEQMDPESRNALGVVLGVSDKVHCEVELVDRPLPLRALYFLERTPAYDTLMLEEAEPIGADRLLASSFVSYLTTPDHLVKHLETCAHIASSVPTFEVRVPASVRAHALAEAIEGHAGNLTLGTT